MAWFLEILSLTADGSETDRQFGARSRFQTAARGVPQRPAFKSVAWTLPESGTMIRKCLPCTTSRIPLGR